MPETGILFGVGATKAGTSSLYRYLHDHPDCQLPAVKEAHYWDTFETHAQEAQVGAYGRRLDAMQQARAVVAQAGKSWKADNLARRIGQMEDLLSVLRGPRHDDQAYLQWLTDSAGDATLTADITPSYAILPDATLMQMRDIAKDTKFVFLIRDPLDRLWSHIRMQSRRQRQEHEEYEKKANNILYRMLNRGQETHILERGDYPKIIRKLRRIIPEGRLLIAFAEDMFTPEGLARLCAFLGIAPITDPLDRPVNEGPEVKMLDKLRPRALGLLNEHYEWVARNVGPLPQRWQDNLARA